MEYGQRFCRDQQRPTEIIKSNIPINRDKSAGLIRLRAFFWIASVELELQQSFLRFPPFTIKKQPSHWSIQTFPYTLGVLRAVLVALTNVYDGKKDIRTYARFFGILSTYLYIGPGRINVYVTILHQQDYHLQNRVCKRYFLTVISVTSLSTRSAARANNL